jgi:hypothetical protein
MLASWGFEKEWGSVKIADAAVEDCAAKRVDFLKASEAISSGLRSPVEGMEGVSSSLSHVGGENVELMAIEDEVVGERLLIKDVLLMMILRR